MAEKLGVYICGGCDIAKSLDTEALAEFVKNGKHKAICPVVKTNPVLCSPEAKAEIEADIASEGLEAVAICACSPRAKWDVFEFGDTPAQRVSLRELTVWSFQDDDKFEDLLPVMAKDYINMGLTYLAKSRPLEREQESINKTILVMGGGYTGLNAALYAAALGKDVVLVEKADKLGGKAANWAKSFPTKPPYTNPEDIDVAGLVKAVESNPKIKVLTSTEVTQIDGAPGMYTVTAGSETLDIGAVVLATGWVPGKDTFLAPLGLGSAANVVTTAVLEEMAANGGIKRPSDSKMPSSVAFVLDVSKCMEGVEYTKSEVCEEPEPLPGDEGEDGEEVKFVYENKESAKHVAYSSELSSLVALKQAMYIRQANPEAVVTIFYDHMMVPGINERFYKAAADDPGIMLTKATVTEVKESGGGSLSLAAKNTLLGEDIEVLADMVVLPTALVPTTAHDPTINLVYRQGPHFPDLELFDGYADSNYICFPYETRRTGVYAAGCVRQPMSLALAKDDAAGAALKAIQCVESANRGVAVHPRSGDLEIPEFNFVRCTQCKRCTEECPFGALDDDEKGTPKPNPTRCRRCGTCMGACPERVISFASYNIDQMGSTIKEIQVPDKIEEGGPRVVVLVCENDAYPALDMAAMRGHSWSPYVRFIPVRCLGSVNAIWVADAMSKGVDGVMLLGCKFGDDYQCHFVKGSELCSRRKENIAESLNRLGVEPERVEQFEVAIDDYDKIPGLIEKFMNEVITKFGPNPFKGY